MNDQAVAVKDTMPMTSVGLSTGETGMSIAPQNLGEVVKFAQVMSRAGIALPKHLRGEDGACMAVALQALEWKMNPFAVASKSYAVSGVISYEAQLIAAVVNTRSGIKGRLEYSYEGEDDLLTCTVSGELDGDICEYESPTIGSIKIKNSPLWKSDPRQQLGYYSARSWARRHCPEVLLGVYDRDEAQGMKDITPNQGTGLADRLTGPSGGFDADGVEQALEEAQEAVEGDNDTTEQVDEESAPADEIEATEDSAESPDPDVIRDAHTAFMDGQARSAPDELNEAQQGFWFAAYDDIAADENAS